MDTGITLVMYVHRRENLTMEFKEYTSGLYYFDVTEHVKYNNISEPIYNHLLFYFFIHMVEEDKSHFTSCE